MTTRELMNMDLDGWKIVECLLLKLKSELIGSCPAVYKENREMIVSSDLDLLLAIAFEHLSPREFVVDKRFMIINKNKGIGFFMTRLGEIKDYTVYGGENELDQDISVRLLTREKYEELLQNEENPFMWAPGLLSEDMSRQAFVEFIKHIRKKIS